MYMLINVIESRVFGGFWKEVELRKASKLCDNDIFCIVYGAF